MKEETITTNQKFDLFKQVLHQKHGKKAKHHFGFNNLKSKLLATFDKIVLRVLFLSLMVTSANAQINLLQNYQNNTSAPIGTFQGINFREAGFSGLCPIYGTNGKEFWTISDRGPNVDCASANPAGCHPTYDKMYAFPSFTPKIHRIRLDGDSIQILETITIKRPNGTGVTGIINPTGLGSTSTEIASTDTVLNCANFSLKTAPKDTFGTDPEGILVDHAGNFWMCEEGGATVWKLNANGVVLKRYTPYANLAGVQSVDVAIDTVFKYRKNNRGFEGIAITPNGKIYAIIQSPILYPSTSVGENSRVHRILEIDPATDAVRMLAYLNDGIIGASGPNQIRLRDWKIGDMAAINDSTFLVLEAALRGTTDIKRMYLININQATQVTSGLYGGVTLEALVDSTGLANKGITPVKKTLFMDLFAYGWPSVLDKAEGLAIINDSTIAICNDNDFAQTCPLADGIAIATTNLSHVFTYALHGSNKLQNYFICPTFADAYVTVCYGGSYTPPGGTLMTATGTQVSVIPNAAGCDSTITTHLTVNPQLAATATSSNPLTFYGYTFDQKSPISVSASGGTGSLTYLWSMSRGLLCNVVNGAGDESLLDGWNQSCSCSGSNCSTPAGSYAGTSFSAVLTGDANFTVMVTDVNGCTTTSSVHVDAIDARCFAGNSGNQKVQVCHHTGSASNPYVTLCVSQSAVAEMIANGDCIGPCSAYSNPMNCSGYRMDNSIISNNSDMTVYPNPTDGLVNLSFISNTDESYRITVIDIAGKTVYEIKGVSTVGLNEINADLGFLSKGIYELQMTSTSLNHNKKIILQ